MREDEDGGGGATVAEDGTGGSGAERRRAYRRKLPIGRGAVLVVGERTHIVGLADVSVTGAYLMARAPVVAGETHVLRILCLPTRVELSLKVEVVRVSLASHESLDHPRGVAVRFRDLDERSRQLLEALIAHRPLRSKAGESPERAPLQ